MELSETVIRASKMRVETVGWAVTTDMLPDELIAALGGVENSQGCIMAPIDSNLKPLNEVTNEFIECAVFVSCRSAMHAKFPLHGTYFQVNVRFPRLSLDVLETNPSCVSIDTLGSLSGRNIIECADSRAQESAGKVQTRSHPRRHVHYEHRSRHGSSTGHERICEPTYMRARVGSQNS